ncbi:MAG: 5-formyltetrahydrofolate cyclo-ligase [Legionellaceae bacterium]|nr:5-formyltetrahydrofolate cyclo-ligase [Legionellaceae bacterium]
MIDKKIIRNTVQTQRKALPEHARAKASQALCARLQTLPVYQQARHIALYQAIDGEIDLHPLWTLAERAGKTCYMPVMNTQTKTLIFVPTTQTSPQQTNAFNITEPEALATKAIELDKLDLMLMPLVAFDGHGTRLGRGAGYYDRTLEHKKPPCLLGVAYEFQHHDFLPPEPWDVPLNGVVTEKTIHWSAS